MIKIRVNHQSFLPVDGIYSDGAIRIKLSEEVISAKEVNMIAVIKNSDDLMALLLTCDALERHGVVLGTLTIPYIPYGREDRMVGGMGYGLKVVADLINGLGFARVITCEPHSYVTEALFNRLTSLYFDSLDWIDAIESNLKADIDHFYIFPDAGAEKRYKDARADTIVARKKRDPLSGEIIGTFINIPNEFRGKTAVILDDICDGGRTFINLAHAIKSQHPEMPIILCVAHGIFSQGLEVFDELIDQIYTTNSLDESYEGDRLTIKRVK